MASIFLLCLCQIVSSTFESELVIRKWSTKEKLNRLQEAKADNKPNFIIFFADDLGYGDLSYTGHPTIYTPNIDYYALSGMIFTTWYSGGHQCSPSRAAMLTGRLCVRSGTCGGWSGGVLANGAIGGLPTNETSFATVLKKVGYNTKTIGKWHLGVLPEYMPLNHGFDEYLGVPYSVDMGCSVWHQCATNILPLIKDNSTIVQQPVDLSKLSDIYLHSAVEFINKSINQNNPFLLYFPLSHVHVPDYMSPIHCNSSVRGFYGAAVEEMDALIGDVMQYVRSRNIDDQTLVFFTSDNGPWMIQKLAGGSAGLFRGAKSNTFEGGVRMPAWAYWPGMIDYRSRSVQITATYDIFSTIINIANATQYLPNDGRIYDGRDMTDILFFGGESKHDCIYYWGGMPNDTLSCPYNITSSDWPLCQGLWAVRCGQYKAHWVTREQNRTVHTLQEPPLLFNINWDPSEKHPIWPDNEAYDEIMAPLFEAKWNHLSSIKKVANEFMKGSTSDNWFCGDPHSQQKYPNYPNCTSNPENWEAFVCNPVCLDFDKCGTSYPGL